ncbi:hypothetical protein EJ06DRAFT_528704 [Trichodelitschia bisporula]|uniref:Uncharacterized protein n=1 Tax=Trichodelitschia bisporula TaxID=703511 RepID=A0A6G1I2W5_9PEZI|nr:hypothetical protein EJ06DRAFT_528704 [Trichodelitschia bisporula]
MAPMATAMAFPTASPTDALAHDYGPTTTAAELKLERTSRTLDSITQSEHTRLLSVKHLLLAHELDDLNTRLIEEEERGDALEMSLDDALAYADERAAQIAHLTSVVRAKEREIETARAELTAATSLSTTNTQVLAEKLALTREISSLKPEVEHLRTQSALYQQTLSEKLALQREVTTLTVELETAQRAATRAVKKVGKTSDLAAEYDAREEALEAEVAALRAQLRESKAEASSLKKDAEVQSRTTKKAGKTSEEALQAEVDDLRSQLRDTNAKMSTLRSRFEAQAHLIEDGDEDGDHYLKERIEDLRESLWEAVTEKEEAEEKYEMMAKEMQALIASQEVVKQQQVELRKEIEAEKRAHAKAEKAAAKAEKAAEKLAAKAGGANNAAELAKLRAELEEEKAARLEAEKAAGSTSTAEITTLRTALDEEKTARLAAEKAAASQAAAWEAQRALLEDKLSNFRTKLRSTKEKLRAAEEAAATAAAAAPAPGANPRKRRALPADEELGTPGEPPVKRGRSVAPNAAGVGDKSTFSITPFLNRVGSVAPEDSDKDGEEEDAPVEVVNSPSTAAAVKKPRGKKPAAPLAPVAAARQNAKGRGRKKIAALEKVPEEGEEADAPAPEPVAAVAPTAAEPEPAEPAAEPTSKPFLPFAPKLKPASQKPRKSLASFATFTTEGPAEKKKRRKLGGSGSTGPKTLFDEEEDAAPAKPIPGRGLFGRGGLKGTLKMRQPLVVVEDGFEFSPLKRGKKGGK